MRFYRSLADSQIISDYFAHLSLSDEFENLEFARLQVGMDPVDDGGLSATFHRAIDWMGASGTSWIALVGVADLVYWFTGGRLEWERGQAFQAEARRRQC